MDDNGIIELFNERNERALDECRARLRIYAGRDI